MARKTFDIFAQKDWLPFKLLLNMSLICNYLKEQKNLSLLTMNWIISWNTTHFEIFLFSSNKLWSTTVF